MANNFGGSMPMYQGGDDVSFTPLYQGMLNVLYKNQEKIEARNKAEKARRQKVLEDANSVMSKINSNGLQDVDIPDYKNLMTSVKEKYNKVLENGYDPKDVMELEQAKSEVLGFVAQSKERGRRDFQAWQTVSGKIENFDDQAVTEYFTNRRNTPTKALSSFDPDYAQFRILGDQTKANKDLEAGIKTLMDSGDIKPTITTDRNQVQGRDYRLDTTTRYEVPQDVALTLIEQKYKGDNNTRQVIDRLYPYMSEEEKIARYYNDNKSMFSKQSVKSSTEKTPVVRVNVSSGSGSGSGAESDYVEDNYPIREKQNGEIVVMPKFMQFNQPQNISGVLTGIDIDTGKPDTITGTTKTKVTGIGVYNNKKVMTVYNEDDGSTLMIDQDKYLNRAGMSKSKREAVAEANRNFDQYIQSNNSYANDRPRSTTTSQPRPTTPSAGRVR